MDYTDIEDVKEFEKFIENKTVELGVYTVDNNFDDIKTEYIQKHQNKITYAKAQKLESKYNIGIIDVAISYEIVDLVDVYSDVELTDNQKELVFQKAMDYLSNCDLQDVYDEINDITHYLREDISDDLNITQVDDLKDSHINN